jgi:hypothetical protein
MPGACDTFFYQSSSKGEWSGWITASKIKGGVCRYWGVDRVGRDQSKPCRFPQEIVSKSHCFGGFSVKCRLAILRGKLKWKGGAGGETCRGNYTILCCPV